MSRSMLRGTLLAAGLACAAPCSEPPPPGDELLQILNTPVESASRRRQRMIEAPQAIETLRGDDLRRMGVVRLVDALRLLTSVDVLEYDTVATYVGMRGLMMQGYPRSVQILIDGVPLHNANTGSVDLDNLPLPMDLVDRIEVVRGPSSSLYGANAVAGVIAITTRTPDSGTSGGVRLSAAGHATRRWGADLIRGDDGSGFSVGLSGASQGVLARNAFNRTPPPAEGITDHNGAHQMAAFGRVQSWHGDTDLFWASAGHASKVAGVSNQALFPDFRAESTTAQAGWQRQWRAGLASEVRLSHVAQGWIYPATPSLVAADPAFTREARAMDFRSTQAEVQVNWSPAPDWHLVLGGDRRMYTAGRSAYLGYDQDFRESATGAYLNADWKPGERWFLSGGLRWENETLGGPRLSPRVVLTWKLRPLAAFRLAFLSSTRSPQVAESRVQLESRRSATQSVLFTAEPRMQPETLESFEAGYRHGIGRLTVDLAVFHMRSRNLISQTGPFTRVLPGTPTRTVIEYRFQNVGIGTHQGAELSLTGRLGRIWLVGLQATALDTRQDAAAGSLLFSPHGKVTAWVRAEGAAWGGHLAWQRVSAVDIHVPATTLQPMARAPQHMVHGAAWVRLPQDVQVGLYARHATRETTDMGFGSPIRSSLLLAARREVGFSLSWRP